VRLQNLTVRVHSSFDLLSRLLHSKLSSSTLANFIFQYRGKSISEFNSATTVIVQKRVQVLQYAHRGGFIITYYAIRQYVVLPYLTPITIAVSCTLVLLVVPGTIRAQQHYIRALMQCST
jgi:hypothetical protein